MSQYCEYCMLQDITKEAHRNNKRVTIKSNQGMMAVFVHDKSERPKEEHIKAEFNSIPNEHRCEKVGK